MDLVRRRTSRTTSAEIQRRIQLYSAAHVQRRSLDPSGLDPGHHAPPTPEGGRLANPAKPKHAAGTRGRRWKDLHRHRRGNGVEAARIGSQAANHCPQSHARTVLHRTPDALSRGEYSGRWQRGFREAPPPRTVQPHRHQQLGRGDRHALGVRKDSDVQGNQGSVLPRAVARTGVGPASIRRPELPADGQRFGARKETAGNTAETADGRKQEGQHPDL